MTGHDNRSADDEALDWAIRMGEVHADWEAFTAWLQTDPSNALRYDQAASTLIDVANVVAAIPPANDTRASMPVAANDIEVGPRKGWRGLTRWAGGSALAFAVGALVFSQTDNRPETYVVASAAGQQRVITMADGSSIDLAGGSAVRLQRGDQRVATVERGQMVFHVTHDAAKPFAVRVGDLRLVDLGTVFDVKTTPDGARVAVAEGAVMVDPAGVALRLGPGQMVVSDGTSLQRRQVRPTDVGQWRRGRLIFDQAPLNEVAADLSRELGVRIRAAPALAERAYSGTLEPRSLDGQPEILGALLGVRVRQDKSGWTLEAGR